MLSLTENLLDLIENLLDLIEQIKTTAIAREIGFSLVIIFFAYYLLKKQIQQRQQVEISLKQQTQRERL